MAQSRQALSHHAKFEQAAIRADIAIVRHVCERDSQSLYMIKKFLIAKNIWPSQAVSMSKGKKISVPAANPGSPGGAASSELFPAMPMKEPVQAVQWKTAAEIHRNFAVWSKVPPAQIRRILSHICPTSLSEGNLLGLRRTGQKEIPRTVALDILEFLMGLNPEHWEVDPTACWTTR